MRSPLALLFAASCFGQTAVWTGHYDNFRTGANINETILTPFNVNPTDFGKLAALPVSGCVSAQPLYIPGVPVSATVKRNLVVIATTANRVYAYDADDYSLHFSRTYGLPAPSVDFGPQNEYHDFPDCDSWEGDGPLGIVGTPVVDVRNFALYFVANTIDSPDPPRRYHHILHKVSLITGADMVPPVEIQGEFAGVPFESRYQLQRAALLLHAGKVYIAFASHQDESPYYGWLFSYTSDLQRAAVYNYSPRKSGAGIWQSGGGPATDGRSIYFATGNVAEEEAEAGDNTDSILQVDPDTLEIRGKASFFPEAILWSQDFDIDLGSSRVIVIPDSRYAICGSKYGDVFVLNRNRMAVELRQQVAARHSAGIDWTGIYNGMAYWNRRLYVWPGGGGFLWGEDTTFPTDTLKAYAFARDGPQLTPLADGQSDGFGAGYQGASIVISANGNDPATGIVWALAPASNTKLLQTGYLRAYDAASFAEGSFKELWNNQDPDHPEEDRYFAKFNQPLIANGKVYLPTFSGEVAVYGLK